jgi:hypothetical protein
MHGLPVLPATKIAGHKTTETEERKMIAAIPSTRCSRPV